MVVQNFLPIFVFYTFAVFCAFFLVLSITSENETVERVVAENAENSENPLLHYFSRDQLKNLACEKLIAGDEKEVQNYVNGGRLRLEASIGNLPMDCTSVRTRIIGKNHRKFKKLERPLAFARNVFTSYEIQEIFLSTLYHPENRFCYALDIKSSETFKDRIRTLGECFENIEILDQEFDFNSAGHFQNRAHLECLKLLVKHLYWQHVVPLQNYDMAIKSIEHMSKLSGILESSSVVSREHPKTWSFDYEDDWRVKTLKLLKNESVPQHKLDYRLRVSKSFVEVFLHRSFAKSIFDHLNLDTILERFDHNGSYYGVDELLFSTLYYNMLGLKGSLESDCNESYLDEITIYRHWHLLEPYDGPINNTCLSNFKRHKLCILGVEYLPKLSKSQFLFANKPLETFDLGTAICVQKMIESGQTGPLPTVQYLNSTFPQFREMLQKKAGTFGKVKFDC